MEEVSISFRPQSYKWDAYTIILSEEMAQVFNSGKSVQCDLMVAEDGNTTLLRAVEGTGWFLMRLYFSGTYSLLRGDGHIFLASSGSWSGGGQLRRFHRFASRSSLALRR